VLSQIEKMFFHLSEAVLLIDPYSDRIVQANPSAQQLLGYTQKTLLELRPSHLFTPDLAKMISFTQAVLHRGHGWNNELHILNQQGELVRLEISASLLHEPDASLMICSLRNYAQLEELRHTTEANSLHREGLERWKSIESVFSEFERQNQLILNAAGEGIYGMDTEGDTTFVNAAAERILGWKAEELIGLDRSSLLFVANHAFDCIGAKSYGMRTAFIDRRKRPFGETPHQPDLVLADFAELAELMAG